MALSDPEFKRLLARAFDGAWHRYYCSGRATVDPEIARPKLAIMLAKMAREGERDEKLLVAAGVSHLIFQNSVFLNDPKGPFSGSGFLRTRSAGECELTLGGPGLPWL